MRIDNYNKKVKKLISKLELSAETTAKKRVLKVKKLVEDSIKLGYLTPKLKKDTIKSKRSKGYLYPEHPLYGLGEENGKSMLRGLRVRKIKNGWRLAPEGKHHSGLSQQTIWTIHEFGATLTNGGKIPARKPFKTALKNFRIIEEEKIFGEKI